ncbi:CBS domain-containing protein [Natrinema hispanicum]|uniref:CBS domain-containing protein n=1 Tax=Natrinema hispanicum TaxID=392421 RepID=A0A482Y891_9EURY|nr:CBS domain-containing protein [Natrinema hispanicum]RZV10964.1 CBS domain-containing protein [Natrinema hispanicum]
MSVGKLGPKNVITISPDSDLEDATETLDKENVGALVVTEDNEPVGILTDRDAALTIHKKDDASSASIEDVMTEDLATLHEDDGSLAISEAIEEHNVRRFPIVDDNGELTGIATVDDLVAVIGEQLENVAETIETQSPEYSP